MTDLTTALTQHFGFQSFRPGQRQAIEHAMAGRDTLAVMPTGSGKSLCYQLPGLLLGGTTLVISPLIALMKDQVDALVAAGKRATYVNSTLAPAEQRERLRRLVNEEYAIVYVAPERLRNAEFLRALAPVRIALLAVDEAHCISQWGHDFRPDYLYLCDAIPRLGNPPVMALTATATPEVQQDIARQLGRPKMERLVTGFNRPNISLGVRCTPGEADKLRALSAQLAHWSGSGIIYTGTRREAEQVAEFANEVAHVRAAYYHAGLEDAERNRTQDAFMAGETPIIVATNAFGLGIDKPDIRFVIHYDLPSTLEAYYQEVGRAGRDGQPACGLLLYSPQDRALQEWFIEHDAPAPAEVENLYRLLPRGVHEISPLDLQRQTGLIDSKLKNALRQLERAGALRRLGDEHGSMLVEVIGLARLDLAASTAEIEQFRARKRQKLARMIRYAETDACRRRFILDYFGDRGPADALECCDNHVSASTGDAPATTGESPALTVLECIRAVTGKVGRTGVSKILTASRAQNIQRFEHSPFFGRLAQFKRKHLDELVSALIAKGYVKVVGGEYPVVALAPLGAAALKMRAAIPFDLPPAKGSPEMARAAHQAGGTRALTRQMLGQGIAPDEIARQRGLALGTIYAHLAEFIGQGLVNVDAVIPAEIQAQIGAAMDHAESPGLTAVKALLPETISYDEIRCVRAARERASRPERVARAAERSSPEPGDEAIEQFLSTARPKPLHGPWHAGYALDMNSKFVGARWERTELGDLVYRLKYAGEAAVVETLASRLADLIRACPELAADVILAIPSTKRDRPYDPVDLLARALGNRIGVAVRALALVKTRTTALQKAMTNQAQKQANVQGAFRVADVDAVQNKRVLLLDDFYDSGLTLGEATRVLLAAGASRVSVLTVTKTIHAD